MHERGSECAQDAEDTCTETGADLSGLDEPVVVDMDVRVCADELLELQQRLIVGVADVQRGTALQQQSAEVLQETEHLAGVSAGPEEHKRLQWGGRRTVVLYCQLFEQGPVSDIFTAALGDVQPVKG